MGDKQREGVGALSQELDRFRLMAKVFRQMPAEFMGMHLQPLTAGRWDILLERNNAFLFGDEPAEEPDREKFESEAEFTAAHAEWMESLGAVDSEMLHGICEFLWVHTAPIEEVLDSAEDPKRWAKRVKGFAMRYAEMSEIVDFMLSFRERLMEMVAAMVEIASEEEGDEEEPGKPRQSLTGSPPTSTPSPDTEALRPDTGSCGGSPSPRGSNTCTAPTGKPEASASGHGIPTSSPEENPETGPGRPS